MKIVDLTHDLNEQMLTFGAPWHPRFECSQWGRHHVEGRQTCKVTFGTHTGTQVDAPLHFIKDGKSIDQVPLDTLLGPVKIFDFTHKKPGEFVSREELEALELGDRILFYFGWDKIWPHKKYYDAYPWFNEGAAKYLVEKGVKLIGFDTPSPDDPSTKLEGELLGTEQDSPIHKILLGNDVIIAEYLANLGTLDSLDGWTLAALPLKITGADGSPARICVFK